MHKDPFLDICPNNCQKMLEYCQLGGHTVLLHSLYIWFFHDYLAQNALYTCAI